MGEWVKVLKEVQFCRSIITVYKLLVYISCIQNVPKVTGNNIDAILKENSAYLCADKEK